ncbi:hypothetical protein SKAU_G00272460 [Synaphobranchus kaupii]|uniref:Uncharacterized protein n=1 Tax=Synaphobranchus kaupii TaxID=118154 RepID=A0A9Q1F0J9_SYNKA|nr:hypothetical protein SKAU_G00272460 [Synaphobranchus kaupii]
MPHVRGVPHSESLFAGVIAPSSFCVSELFTAPQGVPMKLSPLENQLVACCAEVSERLWCDSAPWWNCTVLG